MWVLVVIFPPSCLSLRQMIFRALLPVALLALLVRHADSATYYVRLVNANERGILAPSGLLRILNDTAHK